MCVKTTSKLSGCVTSNYERDFPPLIYVENTNMSLYVEDPHNFNFFFGECTFECVAKNNVEYMMDQT